MKKIVFDIETSNIFSDVGKNDPSLLDLSVIAVYDFEEDKYTSYFQEELPKLWPKLEKADVIIGFNSEHFDLPLLNKYYHGDLSRIKHIDLLKEIKQSLGRRIKLDTIAEATLDKKKTGHGLEAVTWWRKGEKQKVADYCIEDVRITKEVYDFALKNGELKYKEGFQIKSIPIDTSHWESKEDSAMTHTLPF
ncbi:MAG: helicase [Parcubacteria group bacterium CG11_big_fil_rev_8_21_14_0_20_39_22]|nr:MAG: helicase [Parcubacteria group bacterium CG11_big_fil_rev_8_21_14_0_20_39_22]